MSGFFKPGNVGDFVYEHINILKNQGHALYREPINEDEVYMKTKSSHHLHEISNHKNDLLSDIIIQRENFIKTLNDWSSGPLVNSYGKVQYNNKSVRIRNVLFAMYNDIMEAVESCESPFEFIDEKQFKEELVYFMYILSDIDR